MGGYPNPGTPADGRLSENQTTNPGGMRPAGDASAGDMPQMTHQLIAPPAKCIEPGEMGEPQWRGSGR